MSDLVPRRGTVARRTGTDVSRPVEPATTTEHVSFDGDRVTWADLPTATRRAARRPSAVVAEDVACDRVVHRDAGRPFEGATAWRVVEDGVLLGRVRRPLRPGYDGGYLIAGGWEHRSMRFAPFLGPLRRRSGFVAVADELAAAGPVRAGVRPDHADAAAAWRHLPAAVRDAAQRLVPDPDLWLGQIVQSTTRAGLPQHQSVLVLRMSATRAVVIQADRALPHLAEGDAEALRRQLARTPWLVDQAGGDLGAPPARPGGASGAGPGLPPGPGSP